jgi:hypothetical protein
MIFKGCKICYRFIDLQLGEIYNGRYRLESYLWQDNIEFEEDLVGPTDLVDKMMDGFVMATTIALVLHTYSSSVCAIVGRAVISWICLPSYSSSSLLICLSFLIQLLVS